MTFIYNKTSEKEKRKFLRNNMPKAEIILWSKLKSKQLNGYKFRRQHGIGRFVVDFYCPELKLVIEVDGDSHFVNSEAQEYDKERGVFIQSLGIKFLRFLNTEIYKNLDGVLEKISNDHPAPLLSKGEKEGVRLGGVGGGKKKGSALFGNKVGQTLVELLLALGIFAFIMTAVFALVFGGLTTGLRTEEQDYATMYAQEGLDAARSIRDTNWDSFIAANDAPNTHGVANSGTGWSWSSTNNEITSGARKYTREISLENVYRDANGDIFTGNNSANFDYANNADYQCEGGACPSANIDNIAGTAQLKKKIFSINPRELAPDANTKALYHLNANEGVELPNSPGQIAGTVGLWHLNEGNSAGAQDSSGSSNSAFLGGIKDTIANPSFETFSGTKDDATADTFTNWTANLAGLYAVTGSLSATALKTTYSGSGDNFIQHNLAGALVPGATYTLSFYAKADSAVTVSGIYLQEEGGGWGGACSMTVNLTTVWTQYSATCAWPANFTPSARIILRTSGNAANAVYYDEINQIKSGPFYDNFIAANGSAPARWWTMGSGTANIQNNSLYVSAVNASQNGAGVYGYGKIPLRGDFDVQVDFSNFAVSGTNGGLVFDVVTTDGAYVWRIQRMGGSGWATIPMHTESNYDGTAGTYGSASASYTSASGSFRIARVGTTFTVYYNDNAGSGWVSLRSYATSYAGDVYPNLFVRNDTTATSISGNFDNFKATKSPTWTTAGKFSNALSFDGVDDYVSAADSNSLDIGTDKITLEAWVKTSADGVVVAKNSAYVLRVGAGKVYGTLATANNGWYTKTAQGTSSVTDNQWHHIAFVYDGSTIRVYKDGTAEGSPTTGVSGVILNQGTPFEIGVDSGTGRYAGLIDEVAVYNAALTAAQIKEHYERGLAVDAEGKGGNTGTLAASPATPTWTTAANAKLGASALSFDGNDYVNIPDSSAIDLANISIETWVYPTELNTGASYAIINKTSAWNSDCAFLIWHDWSSNTLIFTAATSPTSCDFVNSGVKLPLNQWTHIVATYNGTTRAIYINGVLKASNAGAGPMTTNSTPLRIGGGGTQGSWKGLIDEVTIYNRALSAAEISSHYNSNNPSELTGKEPGMVGLWHLNDGSGTTAADSKGDHGAILGPTSTTSQSGLGQALSFDGVDDYVDTPLVIGPGSSSFTVEAWVNTDTLTIPNSDWQKGIASNRSTNPNTWDLYMANNSRFGFAVWDNNSSGTSVVPSTTIATETWYHLAAVYDASAQTINIYQNGVPATPVSTAGKTFSSNLNTVHIGYTYSTGDPDRFWDGSIDEVAVWNKALTQQDIWDHIGANLGYTVNTYATVKYGPIPPAAQKDTLYTDRYKEFIETATIPAGTSIDYQLSTDNCATMKYWDGDSWETAGGWNDARIINRYFDQLTPGSTICLSARLNTTNTAQTPVLDNIEIKYTTNRDLAATIDTHTKRVASRVKWPSGLSFQDIELTEYLTDWMYPEVANNSYTEFSAVEGGTAGLTLDASGTIYLSNTPSGPITYTHAAIDLGNKSEILNLSWNAAVPASGTLTFQIRSADSQANLATAPWCGQTACNGTDAYAIAGNGNNSVIVAADNQWIQYRLNFTSTVANETPVLDKITIRAKNLY